jgi:SAM-dependent methyltransferase
VANPVGGGFGRLRLADSLRGGRWAFRVVLMESKLEEHIHLSAWKCLRYEVAINGVRILLKTLNDFGLWRMIEYPQVANWLDLVPDVLVLDIGSGNSSFPLMLALEGARVVAVDLSPARVERQRAQAARVLGDRTRLLAVVADVTALPFRDGAFARVSSVSALEHVPDDVRAGREIGRVMQADALAVITVPYTFGERKSFFKGLKPFEQVEKNCFVQARRDGYQVRFYTDADLRARFAKPAQATIERVSYFGRKILNDWYHETKLNRYITMFVLKDFLLAVLVHPFEEKFLRQCEPFGVIFRMRKSMAGFDG